MLFDRKRSEMPRPENALPGRAEPVRIPARHTVLGTALTPPYPEGSEQIVLGLGCFWGAERLYWRTPGVITTAVGYTAGYTPNPSYEEVCSGRTGHNEVVLVVFDPTLTSIDAILKVFWEGHDPTQGMRQGNDAGTQYRSGIYWIDPAHRDAAERTRTTFQGALSGAHRGTITTEIEPAGLFYYAEEYHQQYLDKVPNGYCGLGGTGVTCPIGLTVG